MSAAAPAGAPARYLSPRHERHTAVEGKRRVELRFPESPCADVGHGRREQGEPGEEPLDVGERAGHRRG
jgi:hypothetical protein